MSRPNADVRSSSYDRTRDLPMSSARIVSLVARREILARLKDKSFILSSLFIVVLILGSVVFQVLIQSGANSVSVGIAGGPQQLSTAIQEQADALGLDAEVIEYDTEEAAVQGVESEAVDAAVIDGESVLVNESLDGNLEAAIRGAVTGLALADRLADQVWIPIYCDLCR